MPSTFACRADNCTTCGCATLNSRESSTTNNRWPGSTSANNAPNNAVFPEPVPPEIKKFFRRSNTCNNRSATSGTTVPDPTNSLNVNPRCRGILNDNTVTSPDNGGITAFNRTPSGNRTSTSGCESSNRRPPNAANRTASARTSASVPNDTGTRHNPSPWSAHTSRGPFTNTSVVDASSNNGCNGPAPANCAEIFATSSSTAADPKTLPDRASALATAEVVTGPGFSSK
ncbi:hypothetical protein GCM10009585_06390 [Brevibacterium paucivorans]